jgi:hypothetical protein
VSGGLLPSGAGAANRRNSERSFMKVHYRIVEKWADAP